VRLEQKDGLGPLAQSAPGPFPLVRKPIGEPVSPANIDILPNQSLSGEIRRMDIRQLGMA
jgi:hypothetical protein